MDSPPYLPKALQCHPAVPLDPLPDETDIVFLLQPPFAVSDPSALRSYEHHLHMTAFQRSPHDPLDNQTHEVPVLPERNPPNPGNKRKAYPLTHFLQTNLPDMLRCCLCMFPLPSVPG